MSKISEAIDAVAPPARILTLDVERLPGNTDIFDAKIRGGYIHPSRWNSYPRTLCLSAKWLDRKSVEFLSVWDDPEKLLKRSWELYNEASIVVTFNGRAADNLWLQTDWATAGMPPPMPWRDVDLYLLARRRFSFESKSLDFLCQRLGLPRKVDHYDPNIARAAAAGDVQAQAKLGRYNRGDTRITEGLYLWLLHHGWIDNHPQVWGDTRACSLCGWVELVREGWVDTGLTLYAGYRCGRCRTPLRSQHKKQGADIRPAR